MRKARITKKGATYHVTSQTNHQEKYFTKEEKEEFLKVVKNAKKKYSFSLQGFDIMDTHVHLVIKPGKKAKISKIMQWILGTYAQAWNRRHGKKGHFWADRFFSRIIEDYEDLISVIYYVESNHVKAGIVNNILNWKYSSAYHRFWGIETLVGPYPLM